MKLVKRKAYAAIVLWLLAQPAWALLSWCTVSATPVSFGTYDVFNASPTDTSGTVSVTCRVILLGLLVSYEVSLDTGGNSSYSPRKMQKGGSYTLDYNLYKDAARTQVWGDGSGGSSTLSIAKLIQVGTHTDDYNLYGRMPAGQNVEAGSYSDTVTVTVEY